MIHKPTLKLYSYLELQDLKRTKFETLSAQNELFIRIKNQLYVFNQTEVVLFNFIG